MIRPTQDRRFLRRPQPAARVYQGLTPTEDRKRRGLLRLLWDLLTPEEQEQLRKEQEP